MIIVVEMGEGKHGGDFAIWTQIPRSSCTDVMITSSKIYFKPRTVSDTKTPFKYTLPQKPPMINHHV
jgi:hypothetical protein